MSYIFTQPFYTSLISKSTGLNSEFFFSQNDYCTKIKELSLLHYLPIVGVQILDKDVCISHHTNTHGKSYNLNYTPSSK